MPSASQNYKKYSVGLIRVDLELETILLRYAEDKLLHICRPTSYHQFGQDLSYK